LIADSGRDHGSGNTIGKVLFVFVRTEKALRVGLRPGGFSVSRAGKAFHQGFPGIREVMAYKRNLSSRE
jgi:hypothetical protein